MAKDKYIKKLKNEIETLKRENKALKREKNRFKFIFDSIEEAIIIINMIPNPVKYSTIFGYCIQNMARIF